MGTTDAGGFYIRPQYADCATTPATYDEVMEIIVGGNFPFDDAPPQPDFATAGPGPNGTWQFGFDLLPEGVPVSQAVIEAAAHTYALYLGCEDTPLRQAPVYTAKGLAREYWEAPSIFLQDGGVDGFQMGALWADHKGRQHPDPDHFGKLSSAYLYDFRQLPDGRIAAYLTGVKGSGNPDALPDFDGAPGYVVFEEHDGSWLIDEQFKR